MPPFASSGSELPMSDDDDRAYFERRAGEEIERARESDDPRCVAIHYALSELYLERVNATPGAGEGNAAASDGGDDPIDAGSPRRAAPRGETGSSDDEGQARQHPRE